MRRRDPLQVSGVDVLDGAMVDHGRLVETGLVVAWRVAGCLVVGDRAR